MKPILRNIPIFGSDRYSYMDVVQLYNNMKVGYDGSILRYGRGGYKVRLPENDGGTVPIRHEIHVDDIAERFGLEDLEHENTAIGFEFEIPLKKEYKTNVVVELWPWDYKERLAYFEAENVFYNSPNDRSEHNFFVDSDEDDYVYFTVLLNKNEEGDLEDPNKFLQKKILDRAEDRQPVTNRLFVLRVKQIVWESKYELDDILSKFECRHDSIIIEVDTKPRNEEENQN